MAPLSRNNRERWGLLSSKHIWVLPVSGMAQFKQWALEYVLSDDEPAQLEITKKAAKGKGPTATFWMSESRINLGFLC